MPLPDILNIGFKINEPKLWAVDILVEEIPISEIEYNLDIPYLEQEGTDDWNLTPRTLIKNLDKEFFHAKKVNEADLKYPIEIYLHKGRWIILDGVHRFTKAILLGNKTIKVRRISNKIAKITKRLEKTKKSKVDYQVPFYANKSDDTHCWQACLKMVLKYFESQKYYSWNKLDKISGKAPGMWTWTSKSVIWLTENKFNVQVIESFNYKRFSEIGKKYLVELHGQDIADIEERHCDLNQEMKNAKEFARKINYDKRIPEIGDIIKLLEKGYLIICCINYNVMNNKKGFIGHFVLIKGFNDNKLIIHDPGLPAIKNRLVDFDLYEKSWAYPNNQVNNIIAIKL